jgi:hypothetical protein
MSEELEAARRRVEELERAREAALQRPEPAETPPEIGDLVLVRMTSGEDRPAVVIRAYNAGRPTLRVFGLRGEPEVIEEAKRGPAPGEWRPRRA